MTNLETSLAVDKNRSALLSMSDVQLNLESTGSVLQILKDINFCLYHGETVSITGPSGSGKTSLMMLIGGLIRASKGSIHFDGRDITHLGEDQFAQLRADHMAIVFQGFHLLENLTALENVLLALELKSVTRTGKTETQYATHMLESVGLGERLNHYPGQLSGGEQQRVALARAFVGRPRLLLADEPTGNLDSATGAKVIDMMFALCKDTDSALILITHDKNLAQSCTRHARMHDGVLSMQD